MIVNQSGCQHECGVDEAGRGSFFGRLYVGAVIFPKDIQLDSTMVKDSKKFHSRRKRAQAADYVKQQALSYQVTWSEPAEIDQLGIGVCLTDAMHRCISGLKIKPDFLLIDGDRYQADLANPIDYELKVDGDNQYYSIAAASILAKVSHDNYILELLSEHPELRAYQIETNMGYGTAGHRQAIRKLGMTEYHRKTFCRKTLSDHPATQTRGRQKCLI